MNNHLSEKSSTTSNKIFQIKQTIFEIPKINTDILCNNKVKTITKFITKRLGRKLKAFLDKNNHEENDFKENKVTHNKYFATII